MGSKHNRHKNLPSLAETSAPIRPLLSKKNDFVWTNECQVAFEALKKQVAIFVELKLFDATCINISELCATRAIMG